MMEFSVKYLTPLMRWQFVRKHMISNLRVATALLVTTALILCLMPLIADAAPPAPVGRLIFQDTFDGPLNRSVWNPFMTDNNAAGWPWNMQAALGNPSSGYKPNGYGADYDLPSEIHTGVPGIGLALADNKGTAAPGYTWTGSAICSYPNAKYGDTRGFTFDNAYIEVCAKMPEDLSDGGWPAIWFLAAPGSHGQEIDLFEGGFTKGEIDPDRIVATTLQNYDPNGAISQVLTDTGKDLGAAYHTYGLAYKSGEYIKCYFDGKLVASWTGARMKPDKYSGSYFIIINNSMASSLSNGWHSVMNSSTPASGEMRVKYVRAWALK